MNLDHLIFIVQENRSFDHYFGTFPGADGIPTRARRDVRACVPDPNGVRAGVRTTTATLFDGGGPHGSSGGHDSTSTAGG